ncbi:MAG TPA: CHAP domain-containing protein, partial [Acidimicrobiales bacterium]|nr:CHAP domain-containing protein [Acidimicrobiales bacterium]
MARRSSRWLGVFLLSTLTVSSSVVLLATTSSASVTVATSTHETPWQSEVGVTVLCAPNASYACTGEAYNSWAAAPSGWAWTEYGKGIASENSYGPHNCTLYVAYRLQQSGLVYPGWHNNADDWAIDAAAAGDSVNQTPAVGSVAQWNNPSTGGHVAIVEQVTSTYIVVTADNYQPSTATFMPGGYTDSYEIALTSPAMPDNFIHFSNVITAPVAPTNGSFVSYLGNNYVIAGGAPEYISNWPAVGGVQTTEALSATQWSQLAPVPTNGTFLCADGAIYIVAGGAPEYVSSWGAIGGEQPCVTVDPADVTNAGTANPWNHLDAYPSNGTFLEQAITGSAYEVIGGFALPVDSCASLEGCANDVYVDPADISNAGGAAPWNHLAAQPSAGTSVEDTSTSTYWTITNGCRSASASSPSAVGVDGAMLAEILLCPTIPAAPSLRSLVARKGSLVIRIQATLNPVVP